MVKSIIISALVLLSVWGCKKNNPEINNKVMLGFFDEVQFNSPFVAELMEDSVFYVEVIGFQNTVESVDVKVENGVLFLENRLKGKFLKPKANNIKLVIHANPLRLVQANETCEITTRNPITSLDFGIIMKSKGNFAELEVQNHSFYYWNNYPCGGKLTLRGKTDQLQIWNTAIFSVDAKALEAKYGYIENSSKGKCEVQITDAIDYEIKGEGNIEVYGSPSIINENGNSGSGVFVLN